MSQLTELFYNLSGVQPPICYVETGCYEGLNFEQMISGNKYLEYHSIELDPNWYEFNRARFSHLPNVFMHWGDSAIVLKEKWSDFPSPTTFYLDAHYSGPGTAHGKLETPLLEELEVLSNAHLDESTVIIVDDIRMLGFKGMMPGNGVNYHAFQTDWSKITIDHIKAIMGQDYYYLTNESLWLTEGQSDQLVIFKTSKSRGDAMMKLNELLKK